MAELKKYRMLIGGQWVEPASGAWFESMNPFTGQPWALVPRGTKADVDRAVAAAKSAFYDGEWRKLTATARGELLRRLAELIAATTPSGSSRVKLNTPGLSIGITRPSILSASPPK